MDLTVNRAVVIFLVLGLTTPGCRRETQEQRTVQTAFETASADHPREAARQLEAELGKAPDPRGFLFLGGLHESNLDWEKARHAYGRAVADPATAFRARYGLARLAVKQQDYLGARPHLAELPRLHPDPMFRSLLVGALGQTREQFEAALREVAALRQQNPGLWGDSAEVLTAYADLQLLTGDRKGGDETLRALRTAAVRELPDALLLAEVYWMVGRFPPAMALASAAVRTKPSAGEAWMMLARAAIFVGDFALADRALSQIAAKVATDPELLLAKAQVDRANERIPAALKSAQQAVSLVPESNAHYRRQVRLGLVDLLLQTHQSDRARVEVDAILKEDPSWVPALLASAAVAIEQKQDDHALKTLAGLDALEDLAPRLGCRLQQLRGAALLDRKDHVGAEKAFRLCLEKAPADPTGPLLLGIALEKRGDLTGARRLWNRAVELAPGNAEVVKRIVDIDWKAGRHKVAIELARTEARRSPGSAGLADLLGQLLAASGELGEAESELRRALQLAPGRSGTWLALAQVFRATDRHRDRLEALKKAESSLPQSWPLELDIADAERRTGRPERAADIYERALKAHLDAPEILNNLALIYAGPLRHPEKAVPLAERARDSRPGDPHLVDTLGWVYYLAGQNEKALPLLRQAAGAEPRDPDFAFHLGMALLKKGDATGGVAQLKKALALSPRFEGAEEAREQVARNATRK